MRTIWNILFPLTIINAGKSVNRFCITPRVSGTFSFLSPSSLLIFIRLWGRFGTFSVIIIIINLSSYLPSLNPSYNYRSNRQDIFTVKVSCIWLQARTIRCVLRWRRSGHRLGPSVCSRSRLWSRRRKSQNILGTDYSCYFWRLSGSSTSNRAKRATKGQSTNSGEKAGVNFCLTYHSLSCFNIHSSENT